jgi:hypothetical protein
MTALFASSEPQKVVLPANRMQDLSQLAQLMNHHQQCFKSSVILKSFPSMHPGLPAMLVDELNRPWPHMPAMHSAPSTEVGSASSHCSDSEMEIEDGRTSVILKNIPEGCDRGILMKTLKAENFLNSVNFLYLPMAFDRKETASFRYAFISFTAPDTAKRFVNHFSGFTNWDQALPNVGSGCIAEWCALQGCAAHIARYRNSPMMHPSVEDQFKPILLHRGQRLPFAPPTMEIKPPRQRRHHHLHTK